MSHSNLSLEYGLRLEGASLHAPSVIVGIINHNRPVELIECVRSILNCTYPNKEIVLFDNGSTDDSVQRFRVEFPFLTILESVKNLGAAGARNKVMAWTRARNPSYLLMIDNDTVVEKEFLQPLVEAMENDPGSAVACGTILEYDRRDTIWFGGGRLVPIRGLALHERVGEKLDRERFEAPRRVSYITVCMTLYRCSLLDKIGWQDERYFVYLEDIEFAVRLHKQGYGQLYVPESIIYHKVQGERDSVFKLYYSVRNRLLLIRDSFGGLAGAFASVYYLTVIIAKLLVWKIIRPDFFIAARAGLVDYFRGNLGEGRGTTLFADTRTHSSMKYQAKKRRETLP